MINLPSGKAATIKVISLFGDAENNEGAIAEVIQGAIDPSKLQRMYVEEVKP